MNARTADLLADARRRREQVEAELSALDAQIDRLQRAVDEVPADLLNPAQAAVDAQWLGLSSGPGSWVLNVEKAPPAMQQMLADPAAFHRRTLAGIASLSGGAS